MSATLGNKIKLTVFGESHGKAIGGVLDGLRAGIKIDSEYLKLQMTRRAPGQQLGTPRKEADEVEILSGVTNGVTNGAPLAFVIYNTNTKSKDYSYIAVTPRPSHSDYPAGVKHNGYNDVAGGGHFSGRLTAVLVAAASIVRSELEAAGISIAAHLVKAGDAVAAKYDPVHPEMTSETSRDIAKAIQDAQQKGDSVGGEIECAIVGVPVGVGEPFFDSVESRLAHMLFSVPGVKGVSFGNADEAPGAYGSGFNDQLTVTDGKVSTVTNNSGGINGGLTNGMPIIFSVKMRPTPSIFLPQQTVDLKNKRNTTLELQGRHDPCIALRAVPVIEACAALVIYDLMEEM
ncbi:MAG: chorismate synthase [Clostridia bacterium]|nr:chorismate synthase [Clostridia bacterium]